jgi:Fe-S cluster biogenesis protein NfuA
VNDDKDLLQQLQKVGELVHDLDTIADPSSRAAAKQLVQLLMDLHGSGLERILGIVFQSGEQGAHIIDELGQDSLVSSLLILYGLHPDPLQTRVERKLDQIRSKLFKQGAEAHLVSVNGGDIRIRISLNGHTCGSTGRTVQAAVEEALYEAAPDLTSLTIEGLEQPAASGFVGLEKLMTAAQNPVELQASHSEGMD